MEVIELDKPKLKRAKFVCDQELHNKLRSHPILQCMNKHNATVFMGRPGSGKSSLLIELLQSPEAFQQVYHTIFLCMPPQSRASIKDSIFECLPNSQVFDGVDANVLKTISDRARLNAKENLPTLVVFDDVQRFLRDKTVKGPLLHMLNNRRHSRLSMWFACQTFKSLDPGMRSSLSNMFIFKLSKRELENVFGELIESRAEVFEDMLDRYLFKEPHDFLFVDLNSQRTFANWNREIVATR